MHGKAILHIGSKIHFDYDHPVAKLERKAYALIRRILGEKAIQSTPPPAKLEVL